MVGSECSPGEVNRKIFDVRQARVHEPQVPAGSPDSEQARTVLFRKKMIDLSRDLLRIRKFVDVPARTLRRTP